MTTTEAAMALGLPDELAKRLAYEPVAVTTTSSAQSSAGGLLRGIGNKIVAVTFASASQAVTLPAEAEVGDEIIINNVSANAGVLFPSTGGSVNGESANASMAVAAQGSTNCVLRAVKLSAGIAGRWGVWSAVVN
jgi:hypothetical protein